MKPCHSTACPAVGAGHATIPPAGQFTCFIARPFAAAIAVTATPTSAHADVIPFGGTAIVGAAGNGLFSPLPVPVRQSEVGARAVSSDGRYVAFASRSPGLSGEDDDTVRNVFVKDRQGGAVTLVSRRNGVAGDPAHADCGEPSVAVNAGVVRVAFSCSGPLSSADTNPTSDVYVRDLTANTTTLVSAAAGTVGNGSSGDPRISGNGAFVAFRSSATNLAGGLPTGSHIYRRQLGGGDAVARVDIAPGPANVNGDSSRPRISDDGQRIAFESQASNIAATDTNGTGADVFWRNMSAAAAVAVSVPDIAANTTADGFSDSPEISGDGAYVAFVSSATNLNDGDTDSAPDVHRRAVNTDTTRLISRADGISGTKLDAPVLSRPTISTNGDAVGFVARDATLTPGTFANQGIVRRVSTGSTEIVSRQDGDAGGLASADVSGFALSGNGSVAAFGAVGMTADADPRIRGVYARRLDLTPRTTTLVSRPAGAAAFISLGDTASLEGGQAVSADGRYVVFTSSALGLPGQPTETNRQVWRRDTLTGAVVLISRATGAAGAAATRRATGRRSATTVTGSPSPAERATSGRRLLMPRTSAMSRPRRQRSSRGSAVRRARRFQAGTRRRSARTARRSGSRPRAPTSVSRTAASTSSSATSQPGRRARSP